MNDPDFTPEDHEMPGDNALKNEKVLAAEARVAINAAEKLFDKHDRMLPRIYDAIIIVGEKLQVGRDLYAFDNNGFAEWVQRNKLDQGRVFGGERGRQERTAAMTIYRLVVHGERIEDEAIPRKLDLTNCKRARPDDIVAWARKDQPHLFADLRSRMVHFEGRKKLAPRDNTDEPLPNDAIPDFGGGADVDEDSLVAHLKAENAKLMAANAVLRAEPGYALKPGPGVTDRICSFCAKTNTEVATFIVGNGVQICDECVALCVDLIAKQAEMKAAENTADIHEGDL